MQNLAAALGKLFGMIFGLAIGLSIFGGFIWILKAIFG